MMMRFTTLAFALGLAAPVALAEDFPTSALTSYDSFRAAMLKYGWKPDEAYGDQKYFPSGFPEVLCGRSLCNARFLASNGKAVEIVLWQDDSGTLRVAPQMESDEE